MRGEEGAGRREGYFGMMELNYLSREVGWMDGRRGDGDDDDEEERRSRRKKKEEDFPPSNNCRCR